MDSRFDSQANREMASSMSKPTDARSSAMASPDGKPVANKNQDGLGSIFECKFKYQKRASMIDCVFVLN